MLWILLWVLPVLMVVWLWVSELQNLQRIRGEKQLLLDRLEAGRRERRALCAQGNLEAIRLLELDLEADCQWMVFLNRDLQRRRWMLS